MVKKTLNKKPTKHSVKHVDTKVSEKSNILRKLEKESIPLLQIGLDPTFLFDDPENPNVSSITLYKLKPHEPFSTPVFFIKHQSENDDYAEKWTLFEHKSIVILGKKILENRVEIGQYRTWEDVVTDILTIFNEGKL